MKRITSSQYHSVLGPRALEVEDQIRATIYKLRRKPFLGWAIPRLTIEELNNDTLAEFVLSMQYRDLLPVPSWFPLTDTINEAAAKVFAHWRSFFELDAEGRQRTQHRNPLVRDHRVNGTGPASMQGFDVYRDDQFITSGSSTEHAEVDLPVDLSLLNDTERDLLSMLGNGLTQAEAAEHLGFVPNPAKPTWDHRAFVQSKLRTIRRKLMGPGVKTQDQARAWLEASHE